MTQGWRAEALARLTPTPAEDAVVRGDAEALVAAVRELCEREGWPAKPRVEGSVAKGTYLHGQADADVFVAFPTDVPREELVKRTYTLAAVLDDHVIAYAEHPYAQGLWRGHRAEIVPCYDVSSPSGLRSAVDRTRFHTDLVQGKLDARGRDEVRLLKAFLHMAGCYGAEESVRGFSGYLAELVIIRFGSFERALAWAVDGFAHPVLLNGPAGVSFEDALVVVDPVDATRNAAAAVARPTLERVREAAAAFRAAPDARFFQSVAPARLAPGDARALCEARASEVVALAVPIPEKALEDPLFAQVRRATRLAADALLREQVPVLATAVHLADGRAWGLVEVDARALALPKPHWGPPVGAGDHAARFRERWAGAPDALGAVEERQGRLFVERRREEHRLVAMVEPLLAEANAGKVVDDARKHGTLVLIEGLDALAQAPGEALAELLDRRRPWER